MNRLLKSLGIRGKRRHAPDAFEVQRNLIDVRSPTIFDVGAMTGEITSRYRKLFPTAVIHSFEPYPDSFESLKQNTLRDPRISVHKYALADTSKSASLSANALCDTNSLLPSDARGERYWGKGLLDTSDEITVHVTTLDEFCRSQNIERIDILKLDVQGAEFLVLDGASELLSRHRISLVYCEIILAPTYEGQRPTHHYLRFFDSIDYELFDLYNPVRSRGQLIQADFLFVSRRLMQRRAEQGIAA